MTNPNPVIVVLFNGHHVRVVADNHTGRPRYHHLDVMAAMYDGYDTSHDPYSDITEFPTLGEWGTKFDALEQETRAALKAVPVKVPPT